MVEETEELGSSIRGVPVGIAVGAPSTRVPDRRVFAGYLMVMVLVLERRGSGCSCAFDMMAAFLVG